MSQLWYINKIKSTERASFEKALRYYCGLLKINPNWLMFIMNFESAGTFSPSIRNPYSGGVGLIQFMQVTAKWLGTSTDALAALTATKQLFYVYKFYKSKAGKYKSGEDMYLFTFYPYAIGKPNSYVIGSEQGINYARLIKKQNPSLSIYNKDTITLGEWRIALRKIITNKITETQTKEFYNLKNKSNVLFLSFLIATTIYLTKNKKWIQ